MLIELALGRCQRRLDVADRAHAEAGQPPPFARRRICADPRGCRSSSSRPAPPRARPAIGTHRRRRRSRRIEDPFAHASTTTTVPRARRPLRRTRAGTKSSPFDPKHPATIFVAGVPCRARVRTSLYRIARKSTLPLAVRAPSTSRSRRACRAPTIQRPGRAAHRSPRGTRSRRVMLGSNDDNRCSRPNGPPTRFATQVILEYPTRRRVVTE